MKNLRKICAWLDDSANFRSVWDSRNFSQRFEFTYIAIFDSEETFLQRQSAVFVDSKLGICGKNIARRYFFLLLPRFSPFSAAADDFNGVELERCFAATKYLLLLRRQQALTWASLDPRFWKWQLGSWTPKRALSCTQNLGRCKMLENIQFQLGRSDLQQPRFLIFLNIEINNIRFLPEMMRYLIDGSFGDASQQLFKLKSTSSPSNATVRLSGRTGWIRAWITSPIM